MWPAWFIVVGSLALSGCVTSRSTQLKEMRGADLQACTRGHALPVGRLGAFAQRRKPQCQEVARNHLYRTQMQWNRLKVA